MLSAAQMEFGIIPHDHRYAPSWIDEQKAAQCAHKFRSIGCDLSSEYALEQ